jgi:hypothetical protein
MLGAMKRLMAILPGLLLAAGAHPALAQGFGSVPRPAAAPPPRQAPPALPGLQGRRAPAPIPGDANANLSPNDALFDAITRGDLLAAREAVGRGANIEATNVLGLTPIDSAVDQGRTEIMFYLLSVRGTARGGAGPPPEARAAAAPPRTPRDRRPPPPAAAGPDVPAAVPTVRNPRLWAGDGGAPIPAIGFLGFDAGRPSAAPPPAARPAPPRRGRA